MFLYTFSFLPFSFLGNVHTNHDPKRKVSRKEMTRWDHQHFTIIVNFENKKQVWLTETRFLKGYYIIWIPTSYVPSPMICGTHFFNVTPGYSSLRITSDIITASQRNAIRYGWTHSSSQHRWNLSPRMDSRIGSWLLGWFFWIHLFSNGRSTLLLTLH